MRFPRVVAPKSTKTAYFIGGSLIFAENPGFHFENPGRPHLTSQGRDSGFKSKPCVLENVSASENTNRKANV